MEILISDDKTIKTLQEEFSRVFPFLKLEVFSKPHRRGEASPKKLINDNRKTLGECRKKQAPGSIKIIGSQKVSDIEQTFQTAFGLSVQVFRKSGKIWLETSSTDNWTLDKQNSEAEELSLPVKD
ncbi:MAG: hypothetical protein JNL69_07790 [Bacteroidia bacterium]|nr:hypothetical protein [Bacteroidia bacterium]